MPCIAPCHLPSTADALMCRGHGSSWHVLGVLLCRVDGTNGALDARVWVLRGRDRLTEQMMDAQHLLHHGEDRMRGGPRGPS